MADSALLLEPCHMAVERSWLCLNVNNNNNKHSKHVDCKSLSAVVDCDCMTLDALGNITQPSLHAVVLLDQNIDIRARSLRRHLSQRKGVTAEVTDD
jgi:hypothetical protein